MRLSVLSALLLAAPLFAQQFPEVEPNDTPGTAQAVPLGSQINSSIGVANDVDWYSFTTPGGYHGISTSGGATTVMDMVMALLDSTGTTCIAWNDDAQSTLPSIWMNLAAGTYTVKVNHFSTTTGPYSLDISHPMSKPLNGAEVEPNNTIATANAVGDGAQLGASLIPPVTGLFPNSVAAAGAVIASNSVASSTTTIITAVGALTAGTWNGGGYLVTMTSGVNVGLSRRITANTATTITTEAWSTAPSATDTFDVVNNAVLFATDSVISATTTAITQTTPLLAGYFTPAGAYSMRMTSGPNVGLSRTISSNTATTITTASWPTANTAGNTFDIVHGGLTGSVIVALPLTAGQFDDQAFWLRCTSGANAGQSRCILRNSASVINLVAVFSTTPLPGDTFEIDQYDVDTYRVDVTSPVAEVVFSVTDGDNTFVTGFSYAVVDGAGNRINAITHGTNLADSGTFANRVSSFRVWTAGSYYIRVMQRRTPHGQPAPTVAYGNYRFELKHKPMGNGPSVEAEAVGVQTNNTIFAAEPLVFGNAHLGNITNSAGTDPSDYWGPITVAQQTLITFQVSMGGAPALADGSMNLRQVVDPILGTTAASLLTAGNTLEAANLNPRGSFNLLLPGTIYYLEVLSPGAGATQGGNYSLEVSALDVPTYQAGNWAVVAANATGCGTAGVPTINRVQGASPATATFGELPIAGQTLVTRTTNLNGAGNFGLMLVGLTGALGPVYNPQPVDLTGVGAPGCTLNVNPLVIDLLIGDPTGTADYLILCPGNLSLAGFTLFMQPCKWDFATPVNPLGIQPGNWLRLVYGTRTF